MHVYSERAMMLGLRTVIDIVEDDEGAMLSTESVRGYVGILDHDACGDGAVLLHVQVESCGVARRAADGRFDAV